MTFTKTAVIGAGTMGSQIAAQMANAGADVLLLDIVPNDAEDRNQLANQALEKLTKSGAAFTDSAKAEHIMAGNLEDDLGKLGNADWILEAIVEKLEIKQQLYRDVQEVMREDAMLSSNTSTLPLAQLQDGCEPGLKKRFCITHFFNPPRQMRLVELIQPDGMDDQAVTRLGEFVQDHMGKTIVHAHDTPGFIANRIGIFWMLWGMEQTIAHNLSVEQADALLGKPLGFPKTGIFGLMDLIGIDLMLDIAASLQSRLPDSDSYHSLDHAIAMLEEMTQRGQMGNKADAGFYRAGKNGAQVLDLQSKEYRDLTNALSDPILDTIKQEGAACLWNHDSALAAYGKRVLTHVLRYAASLVPDIADNPHQVDTAMQLGFNWQHGPFALIDHLGAETLSQAIAAEDIAAPDYLRQAASRDGFFKCVDGTRYYFGVDGAYHAIAVPDDRWTLADRVRGHSPVIEQKAAWLWDIGDDIACLELTTKMDTMDDRTFDAIEEALERVARDFSGLIIGDDDRHFSAGLNLHRILDWCEEANWEAIETLLKRGQETMRSLRDAPFPVVGAPAGKAVGGACEMLLYCDAIQAHFDSQIGLVETQIAVIPSWGGCVGMLHRHLSEANDPNSQLQAVEDVFRMIAGGKPARSAEQAREWGILRSGCGISMNRDRLLADAKTRCQSLRERYQPAKAAGLSIPRAASKKVLQQEIDRRGVSGHARHVLECLAFVLSGGGMISKTMQETALVPLTDRKDDEQSAEAISEIDMLALERRAFMTLIQTEATQAAIRQVFN